MESVIQIENMSVFQRKRLILDNINLRIDKGEFVYLIGRTGSGKSSLLKTLYAELPLENGRVKIAGFDLGVKLKRKDIPHLRRNLGIIFQDFQLLTDRTVEENLKFVMKATGWKTKEMQTRVVEVLAMVDMEDKANRFIHQLSGGEQQRVAIARALINEPEIIIADEPTGNLDPETSEGIVELLRKISLQGTAVMMATHDYALIEKYPSRIIRCHAGVMDEVVLNTGEGEREESLDDMPGTPPAE